MNETKPAFTEEDTSFHASRWHKIVIWTILIGFVGAVALLQIDQIRSAASAANGRFPAILYLNWGEDGRIQLYRTEVGQTAPTQITEAAGDVMEFAAAPDGRFLATIVKTESGAYALWLLDWNGRRGSNPRQLIDCGQNSCSGLTWHPDSRRLIYELRLADRPTAPRLWWVDVQTGEATTVLTDPEEISAGAAVSPDGQWLSYVSTPSETIQLVNIETGQRLSVPSVSGSPAVWHPDSRQIIIRDLDVTVYHGDQNGTDHTQHTHDFAEAYHLFVTTLSGNGRVLLSNTGNVDDGSAAWSPDGSWIVFGRRVVRTQTGRQLWLMHSDGSEARALTDDLSLQHGPAAWSPNGRFLLFQRVSLNDPEAVPGIWLLNLENDSLTNVAPSGFLPAWAPLP